MRIAEIFHSIQGEGQFTGTPTVFVRTTGCNLRCWFCDTKYTSWEPEGTHIAWQTVLDETRQYECEHVVVTGGEPLLQPDVVPLTHALQEHGHYVTVETAGTVDRPVHADLMSISPKLANSTPKTGRWSIRHKRLRDNAAVVARFVADYTYQLKFVIDEPDDLNDVLEYLSRFPNVASDKVWLMPQCTTREQLDSRMAWLEGEAERLGFQLSPRLHIELFGNMRGV